MSEVATKSDLSGLRAEVNAQFSGVRSEIKELTKALRDLIRLDGDIKRIEQAMGRIGREVEDHEARLREAEVSLGRNSKSVGLFDWIVRHSLSLLIGSVIGAALLKGMS